MADPVSVSRDDAVATVSIDRPAAHNSLAYDAMDALADALVDLAADDGVRCLVLRGTGPAFSAGADLGSLDGDDSDAKRLRRLATRLHDSVRTLVHAPKPVVTGVDGVAAGGGLGLALAGDLVVASVDATFEFAYPRIGLSGDAGSTWFLPRLVGLRRAREIVLLDEPVGAERAVELGLATETVPAGEFDDRLAAVAADLAAGPTAAYAETKRLLADGLDRGLGDQLDAEVDAIAGLTRTDDYVRGLEAFGTGTEPEFEGS